MALNVSISQLYNSSHILMRDSVNFRYLFILDISCLYLFTLIINSLKAATLVM